LFKDEVRRVGLELGIPADMINRHPFPGPGLAIRILGEITEEKVALLQAADDIYISGLKKPIYIVQYGKRVPFYYLLRVLG